jgi:iron(III) transport system ATP-binding protein
MVELGDGTQIRVVASPQTSIAPGSKIWLHLPPERCLLLDR